MKLNLALAILGVSLTVLAAQQSFAGTGACCFDDGSCIDTTENECITLGGAYVGDGSFCSHGYMPGDFGPGGYADGQIGPYDLAVVLGSWGPCGPPPYECIADLNGDGVVGAEDLSIVLNSWGGSYYAYCPYPGYPLSMNLFGEPSKAVSVMALLAVAFSVAPIRRGRSRVDRTQDQAA